MTGPTRAPSPVDARNIGVGGQPVSYVKKLLARNEHVVRIARPHWVTLLPTMAVDVAVGIVIIGLSVLGILLSPPYTWFALLLLLIPVGHFLVRLWAWRSKETVITNRRIIRVTGLLDKEVSDTLLEKINDILMRQTTMGRILNYGDLEIISGSESGIDTFRRIADPVGFKRDLIEQKATSGEDVPEDDVAEVIAQLDSLRQRGVLTDEEFADKKRELLSRI
jgi:hypothetical protein